MQNWVQTELDSGERVISQKIDHVRSVTVGYWIGAGSRETFELGFIELGAQHLPSLRAVAVLRAVVLAHHDDVGRMCVSRTADSVLLTC